MDNKKLAIKNIFGVALSNITTIVAGIIIGFIIPKVLTVSGYGFYKTFTLYVTYTGMFSMGIIDGIVLDYGGCDYHTYDRRFFRSIFRWYLLIHLIWIIILFIVCSFLGDKNYQFIVIMIAFYMFFANIVGYFQQISQITQRFKEYSVAKAIQSSMVVVSGLLMVALFFFTEDLVDYRIFVGLTTLVFVIVAFGYICIYRDIVFGPSLPLHNTRGDLFHFSKIGFPLLFANLCGTLILTLDRQIVNIFFPNEEYAIYAFAYNLLSLITVATSAISTVLYPMLKRTTPENLKRNYSELISIILVFVYAALIVYFPLCAFISWFLPKYIDSLVIFRVIFPGLAISSAITIVMHNYYKTLGDNLKYFKRSLLVLVLSILADIVAYQLFKSTVAISLASIFTILVWYLYIEKYFVVNYAYSRVNNFLYLLFLAGGFYLITCISNWIVSGIIYAVYFFAVTFIMQRDILIKAKEFIKLR